ncbi:MAG: iron ABC transporter [Phycisphaerae bacterium]|jgi:manganese/zinc/iron transport system permease protein|nr:iron ABC transporter [Phycisphaerae bacterium]
MTLAISMLDILLLGDWNTRVVVIGTAMLGIAAGVVGTFLVLRKRALLGDTVSHAMLPGVVAAFLVIQAFGGGGKSLIGLLIGAAIAGTAAAWAIPVLRRSTGLKDDAIMGIVLGGGFGLGIALLGVAQSLPGGNQAGLESFIYGRTASMVQADAIVIGVTAFITLIIAAVIGKEFRLLCFDESFGRAIGRREGLLDMGLMLLAVAVTVVGLQAVGLILVIALLIIPAVAARFWTDNFVRMVILAGVIGAVACWIGSSISAMAPKLPAGSIIVLTLTALFAISLVCGTKRGALQRLVRSVGLRARTGRQHLLRSVAEVMELNSTSTWSAKDILPMRSWSHARVRALHRAGLRRGDIRRDGSEFELTAAGRVAADRVLRNHRLWELFLIRHAAIAASHVDRDADFVEHILGEDLVIDLERTLAGEPDTHQSPHPLRSGA